MGDNRGQTIAWLIGRIDGIEKLLQKIAPKYRLMDSDILTLPDEAVAAQRTVAEPSRTRDWASLPPIQQTAGEMPLVAAPGRFVQRLPGATGLPPIVQPLGHEVSPLASAGLVVARARAVEAPAPAAIPAPVQRRASRGAQAAESDAPGFDGGAAAPAEAAVPDVPVTPAAPAATATPIRTMPTVSRQAVRVPERPLTSAAGAARPAPVQRSAGAAATDSVAAALPRPSGGMRRVPSAAPAAPATPVVSREVAHPHAAVTTAAPQPPATPGGPTRRGLGEPLQSAPTNARPVASVLPGPVISRSTTSGPMPIAASNLRPVAQRSVDGGPAANLAPGSGPSRSVTESGNAPAIPELLLPHLPVQRSMGMPGPDPGASAGDTTPAPSTRGPEIRPIAGANPIRPSIEIQRTQSDDRDDQPSNDELPSPWWSPAAVPASDPARSNADAPGLGGGTAAPLSASYVQRSAAGAGAAPTLTAIRPRGSDRGRPMQTGRSAPVAAPVQRSVGSALRPSSLPQAMGVGGRHAATAVTSVIEAAPVAPAPSSGRVIGGGPVVQTSPAGSSAPVATASTASSLGSPTVVQREEASAPAAPARDGSGLPSERDLDELAQALFGRIRGRLRSDLIYDREAKGLTFDNV